MNCGRSRHHCACHMLLFRHFLLLSLSSSLPVLSSFPLHLILSHFFISCIIINLVPKKPTFVSSTPGPPPLLPQLRHRKFRSSLPFQLSLSETVGTLRGGPAFLHHPPTNQGGLSLRTLILNHTVPINRMGYGMMMARRPHSKVSV